MSEVETGAAPAAERPRAMVAADGVTLHYLAPADDLAAFVTDYRVYRAPPGIARADRFIPGPANVRITVDAAGPIRVRIRNRHYAWTEDAMLFGPTSHAMVAETCGGVMVGFAVTPLGWSRLFGAPAASLANRIAPLPELAGASAVVRLREGMRDHRDEGAVAAAIDRFVRQALGPPCPDDALIRALAALILDPAVDDIATAAARLGIAVPRLRRLASDYFGFPPKLLMRRTRFLRALAAVLKEGDEADFAAVAPTYYDRSHLTRDAQAFLGMTARQFAASRTPLMAAMGAGRRKVFGASLQSLFQPERS